MSDPKIKVIISADGKEYSAEIDSATRKTKQFGDQGKKSAADLAHLSGAAKTFATNATIAATALTVLWTRMADNASTLADTADKIGLNVEALQELRFAADQTGVAQNTLDMAMQRFARRSAEAANGTGEAKAALEELGIQLTDSSGRLRPLDDLLGDVAESMSKIEDPGERLRIAFKLFDSEGAALVNTLGDGRDALNDMRYAARESGNVLSENIVRQAANAKDEVDKLSKSIDNDLSVALVSLSPIIVSTTSALADLAFKAGALFDTFLDIENRQFTQPLRQELFRLLDARDDVKKRLAGEKSDDWWNLSGLFYTASMRDADTEYLADVEKNIERVNNRMLELQGYKSGGKTPARTPVPTPTPTPTPEIPLAGTTVRVANPKEIDAYIARMSEAERVTLSLRTATEIYSDEMIRLNAQWNAGDISTETYTRGLEKAKNGMEEFGEVGRGVFGDLISAANGWSRNFADNVLANEFTFKGFVDSMVHEIARIAISQATQPFFNAIASGIGDMFNPAPATPTPTPTLNAKGNVFSGGDVVPFARGGVVSSPTYFPMSRGKTGLMGEAGAESIMPLKRMSNGDLGIQSAGPGSQVINNIIINNNSGAVISSDVDQRPNSSGGTDILLNIEKDLAGRVGAGGPLSNAIGQRFGLRRAV